MWDISQLSVKAIALGVGFDVLASMLLTIATVHVFASVKSISLDEGVTFQRAFEKSFAVRLTMLLGGLVFAFAMGLIAESLAQSPSLMNAATSGGVLMAFHIVMVTLKPNAAPRWSQVLIIGGVLPLAIAGGVVAASL